MEFLQKFWPTIFKIKKGDAASFLIQLIVFLVLTAVFGWLIGILSAVPVVGIVFSIIGSLLGLYTLIGVVLCILRFVSVV